MHIFEETTQTDPIKNSEQLNHLNVTRHNAQSHNAQFYNTQCANTQCYYTPGYKILKVNTLNYCTNESSSFLANYACITIVIPEITFGFCTFLFKQKLSSIKCVSTIKEWFNSAPPVIIKIFDVGDLSISYNCCKGLVLLQLFLRFASFP